MTEILALTVVLAFALLIVARGIRIEKMEVFS